MEIIKKDAVNIAGVRHAVTTVHIPDVAKAVVSAGRAATHSEYARLLEEGFNIHVQPDGKIEVIPPELPFTTKKCTVNVSDSG